MTEEEKSSLIEYRQKKSAEVMIEAQDVLALNHWNLAVNRLYYAVFHACMALLLKKGHSAHTHSGVIRLMMLEFVKPGLLTKQEGALVSTLFNMRNTGDYDDMFDWDESQVKPLVEPTRLLLEKLYELLRG